MIVNPILTGFNPDPSICRAGDDYYIATSTFEWYPGVQIYHSKNLADWELVARPLQRAQQLDMRGNPDSCGVWAPCLSYADDKFWLVYTDVKRYDGNFKDAHNYIVTSSDVTGNWSDAVYVNSGGFDPTLFHDDDGRKWFYNLQWNHRATSHAQSPLHSPFGGIVLQEYDAGQQQLIGQSELVFTGSKLGLTEAPHVFKRDGYYYLTTAEGGTGYDHAVTHARGPSVRGPFKLHPDTHPLTSTDSSDGQLQRVGHGQYVDTPSGEIYHTYLCSRPLPGLRRSPLGRESGIEKCEWGDDGWLRTVQGAQQPRLEVESPAGSPAVGIPAVENKNPVSYQFDSPVLPMDFQWLRTPYPERLFSLTQRPGYLRLYGRESIGSWFEQSLVARRQQHFRYTATTFVDVNPFSFTHSAGLVAYYNRFKFHYLQVSHDETHGRVISVISCNADYPDGALSFEPANLVAVSGDGEIGLRVNVRDHELRFYWTVSNDSPAEATSDMSATIQWQQIGPTLDASLISDEAGRGEHASFTGAFVGMLAFDTTGMAQYADFSSFAYCPD